MIDAYWTASSFVFIGTTGPRLEFLLAVTLLRVLYTTACCFFLKVRPRNRITVSWHGLGLSWFGVYGLKKQVKNRRDFPTPGRSKAGNHPACNDIEYGQQRERDVYQEPQNRGKRARPKLHNNPTLQVLVLGSFVLGGGDLLKVQPGHSYFNGPRKLWNSGARMHVIHLLFSCPFTTTSLLCSLHLLPRRWRARSWAISARVLAPVLPDCDRTASRPYLPYLRLHTLDYMGFQ